jgi:hypothetical protein
MSKFSETWKRQSVYSQDPDAAEREDTGTTTQDNVTKHNGDEINFCAEYKDSEGIVNHRFFNSKDELDQFKMEMGKEVTITRVIKDIVQKPGASRHSAKWDRCVEEVKSKGGTNAYAVCTAQLGEESFKAGQFDVAEVDRYLDIFGKQVNVEYAGPVPESLLSRQDLEGKKKQKASDDSDDNTVTKSSNFTSTYDLVARIKANQKPNAADFKGKSFKDMWSKIQATNRKVI